MPPTAANPRRLRPWVVLGLDDPASTTTTSTVDLAVQTARVRRAYRRALLQHHPDKQGGGAQPDAVATPASRKAAFTVDEIKAAYAALMGFDDDNKNNNNNNSNDQRAGGIRPDPRVDAASGATGLERVDLDELAFDAFRQLWYRGCRCGNARGFVFGTADLEAELAAAAAEAAEAAEDETGRLDTNDKRQQHTTGELLVECQDCSLWLEVHFAAAADSADEEEDEEEGEAGDGNGGTGPRDRGR